MISSSQTGWKPTCRWLENPWCHDGIYQENMGFFQCYVSLPEALAIPVESFVFENPQKRILGGIFFRTNHKRKTWKSFFPSNLARLADLSQREDMHLYIR